jgi:4-hydroxy-2-oxoheptanedioate aldolase
MLSYRLREMWNNDETAVGFWLMTGSPSVAEGLGHLGFDVAVVDMQHGPIGYRDLYTNLLALSASNASPIVRVPGHEPSDVMRALDAGAHGVMCPTVETREECEQFVSACRYPPTGTRSFGPYRAALRVGAPTYATEANDQVLAIIQIESLRGLENLGEIVQTPGLDGIFVGPVDLSLTAGDGAVMDYDDSTVAERHRTILDTAHAAGVKVGMMIQSDAHLQTIRGWGADWISTTPDSMMIASAAVKALGDVREAIGAPSAA